MTRLSIEKAIDLINDKVVAIRDVEMIPIEEALGRILSEDLTSPMQIPPFDRSPLDGFAVRSCDLSADGATFEVIDEVMAGFVSDKVVTKNKAIRLMTGGKYPKGADTVVKLEDTVQDGNFFTTRVVNKAFQNYIYAGEDIDKNQIVLKAFDRISSVRMGLLASMGINKVKVFRKCKASVISTGDELVHYDEPLTCGKIYDSNLVTFSSRLKELNCDLMMSKLSGDRLEEISNDFSSAAKVSDILISTGGVAGGDKDLIEDVLKKLGAEMIFNELSMKPGSHMMCAKLNSCYIFALSGNPFAALATFELFAKSALAVLTGDKNLAVKKARGILCDAFPKKSKVRRLIRARYDFGKVYLPDKHSSGILSTAQNTNCLVDIEAGTGEMNIGDEVNLWI